MQPLRERLQSTLGEKYSLEGELSGGMARVFVAQEHALGRRIVVKVFPAELSYELSAERFRQEILFLAQLQHPHIVPVLFAGDAAGLLYYTMPLIEGESLRERLRQAGALSLDEAVRIACETADALDYAHRHGVIHRDVKPENILLSAGHALLADFGVARALSAPNGERLTGTGLALGTPAYMSPEQVVGDAIDARADVYALACVTYEMLTGEPPFTGPNAQVVISKRFLEPAPSVRSKRPAVPEAVDSAVRRGLALAPADRFPSAAEFADALLRPLREPSIKPSESGEPKRLLVLPFANMSADPDAEYFADGLTEELITDLSHVRALRLISRTSAMLLKGHAKDAPTLARELGVRYVLDGSVRKAGQFIKITAQLVDAVLDTPLWSEKFTGSDEDVFDLQERLSRDIVRALNVALTPAESGRIAYRPIENARAYDCYLRARHKLLRFSAPDLDEALSLYCEGLRILGDNELLLGAMGEVYLYFVHLGVRPDPRYLDEAERCARSVFRLNADSVHGHVLLGGLQMKRADLQGAVRHLRRAVEADPDHLNAQLWLVYCYLTAGQPAAARPIIARLLEVDPLTPIVHAGFGWLLVAEGQPAAAGRHYDRGYELDPASPHMRWLHGWYLGQSGQREQAVRELTGFARDAGSTVFGSLATALSCALVGDAEAVRSAVNPQLVASACQDESLSQFLSEIFALIGDYDEAMRWLNRSVERGYLNYPILSRIDTMYGGLRDDPRFIRLMSDVRRRWELFEI
jgi:eukaryotic-like serine/threonine-protein kinase